MVVKSDCVIGIRGDRAEQRHRLGRFPGYYFADGVHHKLIHIGNVVIADDVEIGACTCVDKAKFGSTVVGPGSKLDNLVQIGHNVRIARGCIFCGQLGVAGSTKIGNDVVVGGMPAYGIILLSATAYNVPRSQPLCRMFRPG